MSTQLTPKKAIHPGESCPGLRAWKICKYIPFGEDQPDSKVGRVCIGHYGSCPRYLEQLAHSSPSCTTVERPADYSLEVDAWKVAH